MSKTEDERDLAAATAALQGAVDTLRTLRREWSTAREGARDAAAAERRIEEAEARVRDARARLERALARRRASSERADE